MKRLFRTILVAWLLAPSLAGAQEDKMTAEAEARFREGLAFAQQGKYEEARVKYVQVLALGPYANVNLNLAIAEEATNRPLDALKHLRAYFANPKADAKKVEALKREMVPVLWGRTGHLRVKGDAGVELDVDRASVGVSPLADPVDVMPGPHTVHALAKQVDVSVAAGETKDVDLSSPTATSAPVGPTAPPPAADEPPPDARIVWSAGRIVVTASLVVVGGVAMALGASAASSHSDANNRIQTDTAKLGTSQNACTGSGNPACSDLADAYSTRDSAATRETVFFVVGGVTLAGAVGTVIAWYLAPVGGAPRVTVTPTMTRTGMGMALSGSF